VQSVATSAKDTAKDLPRVLHIDYPAAILRLMEKSYQGRNLVWETCESGAHGLHLAMVQPYHLIIMSLKEPGIDGARIVNGLKRAGVTTPIILLVPQRDLERRKDELSRMPNVLGCVPKPVDLRQMDKLMEFLRHPPQLKAADKSRLLGVLARIEKALGEQRA
jgi:DNA-binding response OmpR family regulator